MFWKDARRIVFGTNPMRKLPRGLHHPTFISAFLKVLDCKLSFSYPISIFLVVEAGSRNSLKCRDASELSVGSVARGCVHADTVPRAVFVQMNTSGEVLRLISSHLSSIRKFATRSLSRGRSSAHKDLLISQLHSIHL